MQQLLEHINANTLLIIESNQNQKAKSLDTLISKLAKSDQFNSVISQYFPKTSLKYGNPLSRIKNNEKIIIKDVFGRIKTKPNKQLVSLFKEIVDIKRSTVIPSIHTVDIPGPDIFTMIGLYSEISTSQLSAGNMILSNRPQISAKKSTNGKIILENSTGSLIHPFVFFSSDIASNSSTFTDNELRAIILHELGHWSGGTNRITVGGVSSVVSSLLLTISGPLSIGTAIAGLSTINHIAILLFIIGLLLLMLDNFFSRGEEFKADKFAKSVGFGKDLANGLRALEGLSSINSKDELKKLATLSDRLSIFSDVLRTHPSTFRRSNRLLESSPGSFVEPKILEDIASKLDEQIVRLPLIPILAMFSG